MYTILVLVAVMIIVYLGTQPPTRTIDHTCNRPMVYDDFLSPEECRQIIRRATVTGFRRSTVMNTGIDASRTSWQCFLPPTDSLSRMLKHKVGSFLGVHPSQMEEIQVIRYGVGQEYKPHFDNYVDAVDRRRDMHRTQTFFVYLNNVEDGGGTVFPDAGVRVKAREGRACHWYNMHPITMESLPCSRHGGEPVKKGIKYACNIWIRR